MKVGTSTRLGMFLVIMAAVLSAPLAYAAVVFDVSGTSAKGTDVTFGAELSISGDILTVILSNNSPVDSSSPDDVLGSFYFDILNSSGVRPALTYSSAIGDTYKGVLDGADTLLESGADIMASVPNDDSWQFKAFDESLEPLLGFGLGTVGNSALSPNGFNGNIVGNVDFAIYTGDITTQPLVNPDYLVKNMAAFTFTGIAGFTEADIKSSFAFGLGTAPDSLLPSDDLLYLVPEPTSIVLLGLGALALRRKK